MRNGGRAGVGAVVLGMVVATTTLISAAQPRADAHGQLITLVTGDQVVMAQGQPREVRPGPGREGMTFSVQTFGGRVHVVPADARTRVASGQVDRRLFDLTTLTEFGYDTRDTVPVIVTGAGARTAARDARALGSIDGYAYAAEKGRAWQTLTTTRGVNRIWLDGKRKVLLDQSVPQIGAPAAWEAGFTGDGVKVAVIDTGVDETHPDLADRQVAEANFSDSPDTVDRVGHGTHVASIVAGTGAKYRGVASGATILDAKVLGDHGYGLDSWIIAGMEWAAEQGADVANVSLGSADSPGIDPMEAAVNSLSEKHGTLFVVAAGNSGADATISSPGSADAALTVGAVDREDKLAGFSSRGPRTGDGAIKPDVTAPGVGIVAALHSEGTIGDPVEPGYTALSGTSMAAPHVAGAAALLAQQHPDYTGTQLKALLSSSAKPTPGLTAFEQGAGRVDVARAITQSVVSEPTSVSAGTVAWPHNDDEPVNKPLTYRNVGDKDVTLALTLDTTAPAGMFTVSANEITVPAGGTAEVTVVSDAKVGTKDGYFTAAVVATAGDSVTRTPVGLEREAESYDLTIDVVDETGAPTAAYSAGLFDLDNETGANPYDEDGSVTIRLPKSRYMLSGIVTTNGHDAFLVAPHLVLDKDTTVTVDARTAKPVDITPPAAATLSLADLGYSVKTRTSTSSTSYVTPELGTVSTANIGDAAPSGFVARVNTHWTGADGSHYNLVWFPEGKMPTGFTKHVQQKELTTVRVDIGAQTPGRSATWDWAPSSTRSEGFGLGLGRPVSLPATRTHYLTADGVRWSAILQQYDETGPVPVAETELYSPDRVYQAGREYTERFNYGVFGPTMPKLPRSGGAVHRFGDTIAVFPSLFGDGAGNAGYSYGGSAKLELYRDGELIGSANQAGGVFEVPPEDAEYKVVLRTTRPAELFDLSTAVDVSWTFRSAHVDDETVVPQQVSALRFLPLLDAANSAPAGRSFLIPVALQHNGTGVIERPGNLAVDVSYDEGKTWKKAELLHNLVALVHHPADAKSVSLRASATDKSGNAVTQTILRAYKLR